MSKIIIEEHDEDTLILLKDEVGTGEVFLAQEFIDLCDLTKADLLQDWIESLEDIYESVTGETFMMDLVGGPTSEDTIQ